MHRSPGARKLVLLPLTLCLSLSLFASVAGAAEGTITYTHESQQGYEQQLASNQIQSASFNKRIRSLHITLKDGRHFLYRYPAKGEPALATQLQAKHVPVTILTPAAAAREAKTPVHHKLRYIAGGILVAVIVIVAAVLLFDRRRKAAME